MARAIKQFRYYGDADVRNQPSGAISLTTLANGQVFRDSNIFPVLAIGIQTLPGTKFYLNGSPDPIIVGSTGIYELNVVNKAEIVNILIDAVSLLSIRDSDAGYLIIDVLYDNETGA